MLQNLYEFYLGMHGEEMTMLLSVLAFSFLVLFEIKNYRKRTVFQVLESFLFMSCAIVVVSFVTVLYGSAIAEMPNSRPLSPNDAAVFIVKMVISFLIMHCMGRWGEQVG